MPTLIVALDFPAAEPARQLAKQLEPQTVALKVGKQLFTAEGPGLVRELVAQGFKVFLDLKFHDIPNTVAAAVKAASELGVWMVNVHASGGRPMLEAAANAVAASSSCPLLTAVTVLTSLSGNDLREVGIERPLEEQVQSLAALACDCGLDGVVCSAQEAQRLRAALPREFCLVTPGIRPAGYQADDQTRIVTPKEACLLGVDHLVVGRPITRAADPLAAANAILSQMG